MTLPTKPYIYARAVAVFTFLVVVVLSLYGRVLEKSYPVLVSSIPYLAACLLLLLLLIGLFWALRIHKNPNSKVNYKQLLKNSAITAFILLLAVVCCEKVALFPIERIHIIKYGTLAFSLFFSRKSGKPLSRFFLSFLLALAIGSCEELSQRWIPDRVFDLRDLLLNAVGALYGALAAWSASLYSKSVEQKI